jgi:TRAP-type C4-dicarboxylate transport system permease small subunit
MAAPIRLALDVLVNLSRLKTVLIWLAGGALLVAMIVDTLAMIGRQIELPLIGSIELVQAAILIAGSGALIVATLDAAHARVNLLLDRLPDRQRFWLERAHALASALLFAALLTGSAWIAFDLWNGQEESELLRIPYRPLRVTILLSLFVLLLLALRRAWKRESQ